MYDGVSQFYRLRPRNPAPAGVSRRQWLRAIDFGQSSPLQYNLSRAEIDKFAPKRVPEPGPTESTHVKPNVFDPYYKTYSSFLGVVATTAEPPYVQLSRGFSLDELVERMQRGWRKPEGLPIFNDTAYQQQWTELRLAAKRLITQFRLSPGKDGLTLQPADWQEPDSLAEKINNTFGDSVLSREMRNFVLTRWCRGASLSVEDASVLAVAKWDLNSSIALKPIFAAKIDGEFGGIYECGVFTKASAKQIAGLYASQSKYTPLGSLKGLSLNYPPSPLAEETVWVEEMAWNEKTAQAVAAQMYDPLWAKATTLTPTQKSSYPVQEPPSEPPLPPRMKIPRRRFGR